MTDAGLRPARSGEAKLITGDKAGKDPFVNGLKSLVNSTLTREMTGTTDTGLQSKFQRFQCGQVPAALSDRHKVCGFRRLRKARILPCSGQALRAFFFFFFFWPAGRSM